MPDGKDPETPERGPLTPEISLSLSPEDEITEREALDDWLRENAVEEVECVTPDFAGIGRGKVMPTAKFMTYSNSCQTCSVWCRTYRSLQSLLHRLRLRR